MEAVTVQMSADEYLRTTFRPDVDFVDGAVEERNVGEFDHARLQGSIFRLLSAREEEWNVYVVPEIRVQVSTTRFRVPDVCVLDADLPVEQIVRRPPLVCIEVLSPDDRFAQVLERAKDFHGMGVADVWIFDPATRRVWISILGEVSEWSGALLTVTGTSIVLDPQEAFARMQRPRRKLNDA